MPSLVVVGAILAWGVIVGIDLVTVPQGLWSRPLVAATGAGLLAGDVTAGLLAGMTLELYALDVLPIGASRYPDYSIAAAAAGLAATLVPITVIPAVAGLVGLPLAVLGGWSLQRLRRRNAVSVGRRLERLDAGDTSALGELQHHGLARDALRSVLVALVGVAAAVLAGAVPWLGIRHAGLLSAAAIAGGLAAAMGGAVRRSGTGPRRRWLAVGLACGLLVVVLQ
jgi:mannose/fructose/N-acetylgalactosamine-specific phosphotransferase system component IIC